MVLKRVVSYVGDSVWERTVASIFRLKFPCIILIDVMVLWYVRCVFYVGTIVSEDRVASIFMSKLSFIVLIQIT